MTCKISFTLIFVLYFQLGYSQTSFELKSPSNNLSVLIKTTDTISFSVRSKSESLLSFSTIAMQLDNNIWLGIHSKLIKTQKHSVSDSIINMVSYKRKIIPDRYNEAILKFKENFSIEFRVYDDGVAYRFQLQRKDSVTIRNEIARYRFANNPLVYFPKVQKRDSADIFHTSFEEPYSVLRLKELASTDVGFSPVLLDLQHKKIFLTESDLIDYPGMFLSGRNDNSISGMFAPYPAREEIQGGEFKQKVVVKRKDFIAKTGGARNFPWRVIGIAQKDSELLLNDLVYRLASPPQARDWSWVKPGKCTDEWICGINLYNVPFKAGINTATYKYYIDFAARFHLNYVMLDAGWSAYNDLFKITPDLNLEEVAYYAKEKGVGLALWTLAMTLDRQLEPALTEFNRLGVKFIMTDFMDRDDQPMVQFYKRVAEACANHKLMLMFHGAFKNAGFERTYPHALTREGVLGSEYNIWSNKASPEHDLLLPFIRMTAGPMDYEPGFFENSSQEFFRPQPQRVASQGTRCHQLAMFAVYESPFQVFSGNPSDAWREPEYMDFLGSIPTTWDETKIVEAKLGDYIIVARRKGADWFLAGMTDWDAREFKLELDFLKEGKFRLVGYEDGINAIKNPRDYQRVEILIDKSKPVTIRMASGGGFVYRLIKQ